MKTYDSNKKLADCYIKAFNELMPLYWEACSANRNSELEHMKSKISYIASSSGLSGSEYYPLGCAADAFSDALGIKKINGGAGSRAYEKITDLQAIANKIYEEIKRISSPNLPTTIDSE